MYWLILFSFPFKIRKAYYTAMLNIACFTLQKNTAVFLGSFTCLHLSTSHWLDRLINFYYLHLLKVNISVETPAIKLIFSDAILVKLIVTMQPIISVEVPVIKLIFPDVIRTKLIVIIQSINLLLNLTKSAKYVHRVKK